LRARLSDWSYNVAVACKCAGKQRRSCIIALLCNLW
jgi:hypothetical protein